MIGQKREGKEMELLLIFAMAGFIVLTALRLNTLLARRSTPAVDPPLGDALLFADVAQSAIDPPLESTRARTDPPPDEPSPEAPDAPPREPPGTAPIEPAPPLTSATRPKKLSQLNASYRISVACGICFWFCLAAIPTLGVILGVQGYLESWEGAYTGIEDAKDAMGFLLLAAAALLGGFFIFRAAGRYSLPKAERPKLHPLYIMGKLCFLTLSLYAMVWAMDDMSKLADNVLRTGYIELPPETPHGDAQFRDTLALAVAKAAARQDFDQIITEALREDDVGHAEIYLGVADWLDIPVNPALRREYAAATTPQAVAIRHGKECGKGGFLRSAETLTQLICLVGMDLAAPVYADWADLARQVVANPIMGTPTDPLVVGLSAFGILMRQLDAGDKGLQAGAALLKAMSLGRKAVQANTRLTGQVRTVVNRGFNYDTLLAAGLRKLFNIGSSPTAREFFNPQAWHTLQSASTNLSVISKAGGMTAAAASLRYAERIEDLPTYARIAKQFEGRTAGVLHVLQSRVFNAFKYYRVGKWAQYAFGGWAGLWALATTVMLATLFGVVRSWVFRTVTLRFLWRADERRIQAAS
jgi:hypothetical protein